MKSVFKWIAVVLIGMALGVGLAVYQIRSSGLGNDIRVGPWTTGRDIGTADADMKTRAIVALRGLLALPKEEARYFTAATDSAGTPLSGKCSYTITGDVIEARWWSITLYDRAGWLIPNRWNRHSVGSANVEGIEGWQIDVSPQPDLGSLAPGQDLNHLWIPTASDGPFELTLRTYRPSGMLAFDPERTIMPTITKGACKP